jgi:hypothetical protein
MFALVALDGCIDVLQPMASIAMTSKREDTPLAPFTPARRCIRPAHFIVLR